MIWSLQEIMKFTSHRWNGNNFQMDSNRLTWRHFNTVLEWKLLNNIIKSKNLLQSNQVCNRIVEKYWYGKLQTLSNTYGAKLKNFKSEGGHGWIGEQYQLQIIDGKPIHPQIHVVSVLSRFMQEPRESHQNATKRVLGYIKGTKDVRPL